MLICLIVKPIIILSYGSGVSTEILRVKVAIRRSLLQNTPLCRRELRFPTTDTNRNFSVDRTVGIVSEPYSSCSLSCELSCRRVSNPAKYHTRIQR